MCSIWAPLDLLKHVVLTEFLAESKRVMPLACERVITCRVRAFTLFRETPWGVTLCLDVTLLSKVPFKKYSLIY